MADITQYSRWVSSIGAADKIINAINGSRSLPEIYEHVSSAREDLIKQRAELTDKTREFEKEHGIELRLDDLELMKVSYVPHGSYIIFNVPVEEFTRIMGFKFSGWDTRLPDELESYLVDKKDMFGEVEVTNLNGKTLVACGNSNAATAVMKRYLEGN